MGLAKRSQEPSIRRKKCSVIMGLVMPLCKALFKPIGRLIAGRRGQNHSGPASGDNKAHTEELSVWLEYTTHMK